MQHSATRWRFIVEECNKSVNLGLISLLILLVFAFKKAKVSYTKRGLDRKLTEILRVWRRHQGT